jgi:phage terminase large subunit
MKFKAIKVCETSRQTEIMNRLKLVEYVPEFRAYLRILLNAKANPSVLDFINHEITKFNLKG